MLLRFVDCGILKSQIHIFWYYHLVKRFMFAVVERIGTPDTVADASTSRLDSLLQALIPCTPYPPVFFITSSFSCFKLLWASDNSRQEPSSRGAYLNIGGHGESHVLASLILRYCFQGRLTGGRAAAPIPSNTSELHV